MNRTLHLMIPRTGTINYIIYKYSFNSWYYTRKYYIYIRARLYSEFPHRYKISHVQYCLRVISNRYLSDARAITLCTPHTD